MANSYEGSATPDQRGICLCRYKKGDHQDAVANKVAGVLDFPGDLEASRHNSGAPVVTGVKRTGGHAGMVEFTENLAGRQVIMVRRLVRADPTVASCGPFKDL